VPWSTVLIGPHGHILPLVHSEALLPYAPSRFSKLR
jgi:hypothetical protein